MYTSKNKLDSLRLIDELKLNKFPEKFFTKFDNAEIEKFILEYPAEFYAVRDKSKAGSNLHRLKVSPSELAKYVKQMELFTINVSSANYAKNQLCVGEIIIKSDMTLSVILSNNPEFSLRDAYKFPDYNLKTNIYDKRLNSIAGLDLVIDYIFKYQLFDIIVEFAAFDIPVGINNENVIIYELRTDY